MGIYQLETFVTTFMPGGTRSISIKEECQRFQRENGMRPTLVFDLMGMFSLLTKTKIWAMCGGRHQVYRKHLENFLDSISKDAELVFFEDGPAPEEKRITKKNRHSERNNAMAEIVEQINEGIPLNNISKRLRLKTFYNSVVKYGKHFIAISKDGDAEIAQYANNNPSVLAVIGDDTDFLIFPGSWRYYSLQNIDMENLMTVEYSRTALRNFLGLNNNQMIVLSTLAGNDIIRRDEVSHFHQENNCYGNPKKKFPWLANYIKKLPTSFFPLFGVIARNILHDDRKETKNRIRDSFEQYNIKYKEIDYSVSNPLLHLCVRKKFKFCFKVLKKHAMRKKTMFDFFPGQCEILESLLRKQIGILLQDNRSQESDEEVYEPVYPTIQVPPLIEFLDRDEHPEHDELRFQLLKWTINEELLRSHDLSLIPKHRLIHVLTLAFMATNGFITSPEADLILYTIKQVELGEVPYVLKPPRCIDSHAFRISLLFSKMTPYLMGSLQVTGLIDNFMKISNFDGVFFHIKYLDFTTSGFNPTDQLADFEASRVYA